MRSEITSSFFFFVVVVVGWAVVKGAGIAQWLERRTRDWKVGSSSPCRRIYFSRVSLLCWLLFRYPFYLPVTAVAHKRSRCRWQVTAKHAYTLRVWHCMKWHGAWLYGVHRTRRDDSSFMWHQPCQRCKYTTSVDIKHTHTRAHARARAHTHTHTHTHTQ